MIRIFEAFAGYGSQSIALERIKEKFPTFKYKIVGISEIDEIPIKAYNVLHENVKNYGDIKNINWDNVPEFDLFTYSFPCTDISMIGKKLGLDEGSGTRSALLWECKRAIEKKKPKYLLMENVKALTYKKNIDNFNSWIKYLERLGYHNYYKVLNAKDFNVPQNRERVFMISILGEEDNLEPYTFPSTKPLTRTFIDYLEDNIKEDRLKVPVKYSNGTYRVKRLNKITKHNKFDPNKTQWLDSYSNSVNEVIIPTITTRTIGAGHSYIMKDGIIRKPTERELFRFMGLRDEEIDKLLTLELTQDKYCKLAGNSIVVDVLENIFIKLFISNKDGRKKDSE